MKKAVGLLAFCIMTATALSHPGGLDANGGHYNRKTGSYHTHRSPAATPPAATTPAAPAPAQTSPPLTLPVESSSAISTNAPATEKAFWLTNSSGIRHNKTCRYFNASQGRACGPNEGRACKLCGG